MISNIRDDIDKMLYLGKMQQINEIFEKQSKLPKDARMNRMVILKLEKLYQFLNTEIEKYDKIKNFAQ